MDKNDSLTPQEKKENNRQKVIVSLMIMAVLLIAELYVMINMPGNVVALAVVTILFLGSAYFFGTSILKEIHNSNTRAEEQYEAIAKSGKASYLLLKKAMEQLEEIEGNSKTPADDIITAQKAIAKVTINRNKENTDALMNSNDKVLEKIFDFEENLGNNQSDLLDKHRHLLDDSMKELMIKQQEMTSTMKAMEESIKSELLQAMSTMQVAQPQQAAPVQPEMATEEFDFGEPEVATEEFDFGEPEMATEEFDFGEPEVAMEDLNLAANEPMGDLDFDGELNIGEDLGLSEDLNLGEDLETVDTLDLGLSEDLNLGENLETVDTLDLGLSEDLNLGENLETVDTLDLGLSEDLNLGEEAETIDTLDLGLDEDIDLGEPTLSADLDLGIDLMQEEESVAEEPMTEEPEFAEPEFIEEEETAMPDLSDPHKLMTPDEIAALIAKM